MALKINKATLKGIARGAIGVGVGVVVYLAGEPKYAALGAVVPFLLRWADPTEKEITFGKSLASTTETVVAKPITLASVETDVKPLVEQAVSDVLPNVVPTVTGAVNG